MWFNNKAVRACVCFCCRAISGSRGGPCRAVPALRSPLEGGVQMWCICRAFVRRVLCEHKVPFAVNGSHTQSAMCSVVLPACSSPLSKPARDCTRSLPTLPTPGEQSKTEGLRQGRRSRPKVCFKRQRCPHSSSEHACIALLLAKSHGKSGSARGWLPPAHSLGHGAAWVSSRAGDSVGQHHTTGTGLAWLHGGPQQASICMAAHVSPPMAKPGKLFSPSHTHSLCLHITRNIFFLFFSVRSSIRKHFFYKVIFNSLVLKSVSC